MKYISLNFVLFILVVLVGVGDRFLVGLWGLGAVLPITCLLVYRNLRVEVVSELIWNRGLTS